MPDPSITSGIYSLLKPKKQPADLNVDDIEKDPLYQLELQAIAAQYSDMGQQDTQNLSNKLAAAASKYAYTGPSLDLLRNFGNANNMLIQSAYNRSADYVSGQRAPTTGLYNAEQMRTGAAYENAARDITSAQQQAAAKTAESTQPGISPEFAQRATSQQAAIMNQIQNQVAQSKQFNLGQLRTAGETQQNILGQFVGGLGTEASEKRKQFQGQLDQLIAKATAQMDLAKAQQQSAQQQIQQEAERTKQSYAGREKAANIRALEAAVKRAQTKAEKEASAGGEDRLTGIQGVLAMGMRAGRPDLAEKYLGMIASSRRQASQTNAENAAKRQKGLTGIQDTTPQKELQKMLDMSAGGPHPDIADRTADPRGDLMDAIMREPGLAPLRKYMVTTPDQARREDQYWSAFGTTKQQSEKDIKEADKVVYHTLWGSIRNMIGLEPEGNDIVAQQNKRFTPFINVDRLRGDSQATKIYNDYFKSMQDESEFLGLLDEIFNGKYGGGSA